MAKKITTSDLQKNQDCTFKVPFDDIIIFNSIDEAKRAGFYPCKFCINKPND